MADHTRDAAQTTYTGDAANRDRLAPFRGPAQKPDDDPLPAPFTEATDPPPPAPTNDNPAPEAPRQNPEDAPPMRADPRADIARRARERRAEESERVTETFGDMNAPPAYAPLDTAPQAAPENDNQDEPQPAPQAQQPAPAHQPQAFNLKVNGNTFQVSRDELIRYAGLSDEEATGIPDLSLVRAAQINLAAEDRLASAKHTAQSARFAAPDAPPYQAEDQRHVPEHAEQRQPAFDIRQAVQKIQLGDEDEAAEALLQTVAAVASQQTAHQRVEQAHANVGQAIEQDLRRFASENPDIVNDPVLSAAHRTLMVEHAVNEIARIPGIPQESVAALRANPQKALEAYKAAMIDGYQVRTPAEIFASAGQQVRARFGPPTQQHADPTPDPRTQAKRGLIQQPARNDNGQQAQPPAQTSSRRSPSDVIRAMAQRTEGRRMAPRY